MEHVSEPRRDHRQRHFLTHLPAPSRVGRKHRFCCHSLYTSLQRGRRKGGGGGRSDRKPSELVREPHGRADKWARFQCLENHRRETLQSRGLIHRRGRGPLQSRGFTLGPSAPPTSPPLWAKNSGHREEKEGKPGVSSGPPWAQACHRQPHERCWHLISAKERVRARICTPLSDPRVRKLSVPHARQKGKLERVSQVVGQTQQARALEGKSSVPAERALGPKPK